MMIPNADVTLTTAETDEIEVQALRAALADRWTTIERTVERISLLSSAPILGAALAELRRRARSSSDAGLDVVPLYRALVYCGDGVRLLAKAAEMGGEASTEVRRLVLLEKIIFLALAVTPAEVAALIEEIEERGALLP